MGKNRVEAEASQMARHAVWRVLVGGVTAAVLGSGALLFAGDYPLLPSAYINIEDFGADGSDSIDDTAAIQAAITATLRANGGSRYGASNVLYIPNGNYLISDTIEVRDPQGSSGFEWLSGFHMRGESESGVVFRVADNTPHFSNASSPKPVLITGSEGLISGLPAGEGNRAFRHYIENVTIDTGAGNAGAVGIDFLVSNRGALDGVTIRSSDPAHVGVAGIRMSRSWSGPGLIRDVTVEGFDRAIHADFHAQLSMTVENITIRDQRVAGLETSRNPLFVRNLVSDNTAPAVVSRDRQNLITVLDSSLAGGGPNGGAVEGRGDVYVRNVTTEGYALAAQMNSRFDDPTIVGGPGVTTIEERVFEDVLGNYDTPTSLNLPVRETPTFHSSNPNDWVSVEAFGATPGSSGDDDAAAFEAAFASGKPIVYAPQGSYHFGRTVEIPDTVRVVTGLQAAINAKGGLAASGDPVFRYVGDEGATTLEHVRVFGDVEHAGSGDFAIRKAGIEIYRNSASGDGDMFFEDVIAAQLSFTDQRVFARQLNIEDNNAVSIDGAFIENDGGQLWVMGYKTEHEDQGVILHSTNGSRNEIIGGFFYNVSQQDVGPQLQLIQIEDSEFSGSWVTNGNDYATNIASTVDGFTQTWGRGDNGALGFGTNGPDGGTLYWRGGGSIAPLLTINNVLPPAGDFNLDGVVDIADYTTWRDGLGVEYTGFHYKQWVDSFGETSGVAAAVPEPPMTVLLVMAACVLIASEKTCVAW